MTKKDHMIKDTNPYVPPSKEIKTKQVQCCKCLEKMTYASKCS